MLYFLIFTRDRGREDSGKFYRTPNDIQVGEAIATPGGRPTVAWRSHKHPTVYRRVDEFHFREQSAFSGIFSNNTNISRWRVFLSASENQALQRHFQARHFFGFHNATNKYRKRANEQRQQREPDTEPIATEDKLIDGEGKEEEYQPNLLSKRQLMLYLRKSIDNDVSHRSDKKTPYYTIDNNTCDLNFDNSKDRVRVFKDIMCDHIKTPKKITGSIYDYELGGTKTTAAGQHIQTQSIPRVDPFFDPISNSLRKRVDQLPFGVIETIVMGFGDIHRAEEPQLLADSPDRSLRVKMLPRWLSMVSDTMNFLAVHEYITSFKSNYKEFISSLYQWAPSHPFATTPPKTKQDVDSFFKSVREDKNYRYWLSMIARVQKLDDIRRIFLPCGKLHTEKDRITPANINALGKVCPLTLNLTKEQLEWNCHNASGDPEKPKNDTEDSNGAPPNPSDTKKRWKRGKNKASTHLTDFYDSLSLPGSVYPCSEEGKKKQTLEQRHDALRDCLCWMGDPPPAPPKAPEVGSSRARKKQARDKKNKSKDNSEKRDEFYRTHMLQRTSDFFPGTSIKFRHLETGSIIMLDECTRFPGPDNVPFMVKKELAKYTIFKKLQLALVNAQDIFQLFLMHVDDMGIHVNADVSVSDSLLLPGLWGLMHQGELPDLSMIHAKLSYWEKNTDTPLDSCTGSAAQNAPETKNSGMTAKGNKNENGSSGTSKLNAKPPNATTKFTGQRVVLRTGSNATLQDVLATKDNNGNELGENTDNGGKPLVKLKAGIMLSATTPVPIPLTDNGVYLSSHQETHGKPKTRKEQKKATKSKKRKRKSTLEDGTMGDRDAKLTDESKKMQTKSTYELSAKQEKNKILACLENILNKIIFIPSIIRQINHAIVAMMDHVQPQEVTELFDNMDAIGGKEGLEDKEQKEMQAKLDEENSAYQALFEDQDITDDTHNDTVEGIKEGDDAETKRSKKLVYYLFTGHKMSPIGRRLMLCLARFMMVSLCGLYEHSSTILSFESRREIYRWLMYDMTSTSEMKEWFLAHKHVFTYILRENHIFSLTNMPGLERLFGRLYEYVKIKHNVVESMNITRQRLQRDMDMLRKDFRDFCGDKNTMALLREKYTAYIKRMMAQCEKGSLKLRAFGEAYASYLDDECTFSLFVRQQQQILLRYLNRKHFFSNFLFLTDKGEQLVQFFSHLTRNGDEDAIKLVGEPKGLFSTFVDTPRDSDGPVYKTVTSELLYEYLLSYVHRIFFRFIRSGDMYTHLKSFFRPPSSLSRRLCIDEALKNIILQHVCARNTCCQTSLIQMKKDYTTCRKICLPEGGGGSATTNLVLQYIIKNNTLAQNIMVFIDKYKKLGSALSQESNDKYEITLKTLTENEDEGFAVLLSPPVELSSNVSRGITQAYVLASIFQAATLGQRAIQEGMMNEEDIATGLAPGNLFHCKLHPGAKTCKCLFECLENIAETMSKTWYVNHMGNESTCVLKKKNISIWILGVEQYLYQAYISCLVYSYRPRITSFEEEIMGCCSIVAGLMASRDQIERVMNVRPGKAMEIIHRYKQAKYVYAVRKKKIKSDIRKILAACGYERDAGLFWLLPYFQVRGDSILRLERACEAMMSETNHRTPYNTVAHIACHCPYDFLIIFDFYREKHRFQSIRTFPLSIQIVKQQIQTAHNIYNYVPVGEKLPKEATTYYYCLKHLRFCTPLVGVHQGKMGYLNTHSIGAKRMAIDPINDERYCAFHTGRTLKETPVTSFPEKVRQYIMGKDDSSLPQSLCPGLPEDIEKELEKQRGSEDPPVGPFDAGLSSTYSRLKNTSHESDDDDDDDHDDMCSDIEEDDNKNSDDEEGTDDKSEASEETLDEIKVSGIKIGKRDKRGLAAKSCYGKELQGVDMLGVMCVLNKVQYVLCPYCMHMMKTSGSRWTEIGLWCGTCLGGQKVLAEQRGIVWDDENDRPVDYTFPRKIGPYPLFWNPVDMCCIICGSRSTETRPMTFCLMFNDLVTLDKFETNTGEARQKMGYYPFCRKHSKPYLSMSPEASRLSNVLYVNYRISSATLQNDMSLAYGLEPRITNPKEGKINILDCMDSTALYSEATHRKRRKTYIEKKQTMTSEEYKDYRNREWDVDELLKHSSSSRLRGNFEEEGPIDEDCF